jgi:hypothetical protein
MTTLCRISLRLESFAKMPVIATIVSFLALSVSATTAWLTLFRKGMLRMTRPTVIFFGPDGPPSQGSGLKVFLRTLLYSTSKRAQIIEGMYVTLRRGESVQTFNIWVYGDTGRLVRGSGLRVGEDGVAWNHHFVLPKDGTPFRFLPGEYIVEVYAVRCGTNRQVPLLLSRTTLQLSQEQSSAISQGAGVYFDWGPDSQRYHSHIDSPPVVINPTA